MRIQFKVLLPLLLLFACDEAPDLTNVILDTDIGDNNPEISIDFHEPVFNSSTITLSWTAENEYVNAFRYRLEPLGQTDTVDTYLSWSNWGRDTTSVTLKYLDEGSYDFHVEGRFNIDHSESVATNFEINAITGPALRMFPLQQSVSMDSTFDIYLYSEEITDLAGMQIQLSYDSNFMTHKSSSAGYSIINHGDVTIFPQPEVNDGSIIMSGAVGGEFGLSEVSGLPATSLPTTSEILKLTFTYVGTELGNTQISIDLTGCEDSSSSSSNCNTQLRDVLNQPIQISSGTSGLIEAAE